jgi:hypothetical protein
MKKLEDLPKKVDFQVPDRYFDELPARIQNRIGASPNPRWQFTPRLALRYALPLLALLAIGIIWYDRSSKPTLITELEKIDEVQLSFFIEDPELTSEELAENVVWSTADLDALEEEVYDVLDASGEELDGIIDEMELENL